MGVREFAAPRLCEGLLDFDWQGVRMTTKIKGETVPEPCTQDTEITQLK